MAASGVPDHYPYGIALIETDYVEFDAAAGRGRVRVLDDESLRSIRLVEAALLSKRGLFQSAPDRPEDRMVAFRLAPGALWVRGEESWPVCGQGLHQAPSSFPDWAGRRLQLLGRASNAYSCSSSSSSQADGSGFDWELDRVYGA